MSECVYVIRELPTGLRYRKFVFVLRVHLEGIRVTFIYEGHPVKVNVTAAEKREISCSHSINLESAITPVL